MCGYCGAPLVAGSPPPEIRRTVTIAISDLKGSTALGEKLDPESVFGILALYFDAMRLIFESHGGTIEKIIGDAIVAVFGLTATGDDDALRAVRAAAETQVALGVLNEQLDRRWGVRLVNRTGIATGEVAVTASGAGDGGPGWRGHVSDSVKSGHRGAGRPGDTPGCDRAGACLSPRLGHPRWGHRGGAGQGGRTRGCEDLPQLWNEKSPRLSPLWLVRCASHRQAGARDQENSHDHLR